MHAQRWRRGAALAGVAETPRVVQRSAPASVPLRGRHACHGARSLRVTAGWPKESVRLPGAAELPSSAPVRHQGALFPCVAVLERALGAPEPAAGQPWLWMAFPSGCLFVPSLEDDCAPR